jgi:hypothetical protein
MCWNSGPAPREIRIIAHDEPAKVAGSVDYMSVRSSPGPCDANADRANAADNPLIPPPPP